MPSKVKVTLLSLVLILSFNFLGCATIYNPATGRQELIFISTEDEIQIGKQVSQQVHERFRLYRDPEANTYVKKIGQHIAGVSDRRDLPYYFIILDDDEINAFTIPGGRVYLFKGLLDMIETDDELAGVIAHELGHAAARHIVKKMQVQMGYEIVLSLATKGKEKYEDIAKLTNIAFEVIMLGYSREDEYFADKLAVRYTKRAGYDPQGLISFLKKLKKKEKEKQLVFLSTHPDLDARIKNIKREIEGKTLLPQ